MNEPPHDIIEAAQKVSTWMQVNGHEYWQLGDVCDRRFAYKIGHLKGLLRNFREIVWNHHSSTVMTPDVCPVCTDKESAWVLDKADEALENK